MLIKNADHCSSSKVQATMLATTSTTVDMNETTSIAIDKEDKQCKQKIHYDYI